MPRQPRTRVKVAARWTNGFTGLSFVTYQDQHGCKTDVCTVGSFLNRRRKSAAKMHAEAIRGLDSKAHLRWG